MNRETDYAVTAAQWQLLDPGNPAFRPVGFKDWGRNMQASYRIEPHCSAEQYWARVRADITAKARAERP